jgi:hypothetical protein
MAKRRPTPKRPPWLKGVSKAELKRMDEELRGDRR